jgi:uncharacterized repeat protein (TIGR01451 family)
VSPIAFISSGTQVKHTTTGNYGSIPAITATDNLLTLGKQASPTALIGAGTITYTLTATNSGTADAILEDFTDTLPTTPGAATYIAGSSTFNGVTAPDPAISGSTLTWSGTFNLPAGTTRALTFSASLPSSLGSYTNRAVGHVVNVQIDTTLNTSDNAPATAVVANRGANISGSIYNDANRNSIMDGTESGTGLSLFAKLVPAATPAGPATVVVAATNSLGAYSFTNVAPGSYLIVIDNNNLLSDVTPTIPAGWIGTEQPTEIRNVPVISADIPNQNFGLVNGRTLTGRTFVDNGAGGGIANDGIVNGGETGLAGNQLRLTDAAGTTIYSTATSDASGAFSLFIPGAIPSGSQLKVSEINATGYISTGGSTGNTGGTYNRTTDSVTFNFAGTNYQGVLFGDVLQNSFLNDSQQTGLPGSFVLHSHTYVANSVGQLSFSLAEVSTPTMSGWTPIIYLDANCNGQLEAGEYQHARTCGNGRRYFDRRLHCREWRDERNHPRDWTFPGQCWRHRSIAGSNPGTSRQQWHHHRHERQLERHPGGRDHCDWHPAYRRSGISHRGQPPAQWLHRSGAREERHHWHRGSGSL